MVRTHLPWCKEHSLGFLLHYFNELCNRTVVHAESLAMFDTGWLFSGFGSPATEVTQVSGERNIVDSKLIEGFQDILSNLYTPLIGRIIVLLLAGYFTGMAASTIFIVYE
jgi:hypothetical protein